MAEWGAAPRADPVLGVLAEPTGLVARGDIYRSKVLIPTPETIPSAEAAAEKILSLAEQEGT